jgi:integrase
VNFQNAVDAGNVLSRKEKDAARIAAAEALAKLPTVKEYADIFMATKEQSISENTRLSYKTNLDRHILPQLGGFLMKDVTPAMIQKLLLDFQAAHSYGSAVKVYNILHGLFDMALFDDTIPVSPMNRVKRPKQKKDDRAVTEADKALFEDELNYVLDCAKNEPLKWQAFIYLAADTGARRGELCGLQWEDIDMKNGWVHFKRNLQYSTDKGVYETTLKNGKPRDVDIGEDTIAILKAYKKSLTSDEKTDNSVVDINTYKQKKQLSKWVFTADNSSDPMFPHTPTRYLQKFSDRYNIPGLHPHLFRHTSATLSLTNGADLKSTADRLGHSDAVMLRNYAHANDISKRKAGQAARDALKRKQQEKIKAEA